jgi:hypothetical protein
MPQPMMAVIVSAIRGTARKGRPSGEATQGGEHMRPSPWTPTFAGVTRHSDEF